MNCAEVAAALDLLRDNVHLAGTGTDAAWYYPPTLLDENGRLWGCIDEHLDRVYENRVALRLYYRSLQSDAPVPALLGRSGLLAVVETFTAGLLSYYRPLQSTTAMVREGLTDQVAVLLAEANALHNVALTMRL